MGCAVDLYLRAGGDGARDPGTWEYLGQGGARHHIVQEPNVNLPACCFFAVLPRRARRWAGLGSPASRCKGWRSFFAQLISLDWGQLRVSRKLRPSRLACSLGSSSFRVTSAGARHESWVILDWRIGIRPGDGRCAAPPGRSVVRSCRGSHEEASPPCPATGGADAGAGG